MTCDCGYSTPTTKWDGRPLSDAQVRGIFRSHRCAPRDPQGRIIEPLVCCDCGTLRMYRTRSSRCHSCWIRLRLARQDETDEMAVARLLAGNPPPRTTRAERQAAVAYLTERGLPADVIAERIRVSERTVVRLRNRGSA